MVDPSVRSSILPYIPDQPYILYNAYHPSTETPPRDAPGAMTIAGGALTTNRPTRFIL